MIYAHITDEDGNFEIIPCEDENLDIVIIKTFMNLVQHDLIPLKIEGKDELSSNFSLNFPEIFDKWQDMKLCKEQ